MPRQWVKEELRKDELVSTTKKIVQFVVKRKKIFQVLGMVILVIAVLVPVVTYWWRNLEAKAIDKMNEANSLYDINQNKEARDIYQKIVKDYLYTETSSEALFYIGNCDYNLGEYDAAIEIYQKYIKKYPRKMLTPFAYENIGICKEEKNDYKGAIQTYKELIEKYPQSFIVPKIYLNLGRCLTALNNKSDAEKQYQRILDFYPNSVWASKAKEKIEELKPPTVQLPQTIIQPKLEDIQIKPEELKKETTPQNLVR